MCSSDLLAVRSDRREALPPAERESGAVGPAAVASLVRIGEMVHGLDVGGEPTAEASGFEAMLSGARTRIDDDDQLLAEMAGLLDSLYVHFQSGKASK